MKGSIRGEPGTIFLSGKITSRSASDIMEAYSKASQAYMVSLDFSEVGSLDVSGINALIKLHILASSQGKRLRATRIKPAFREIFKTTHLDEAIPFDSSQAYDGDSGFPAEWPWARPAGRLKVSPVPEGAVNLNIDGFTTAGPVQGFGHLWEKTYRIQLTGVDVTPREVIKAFKENFPSFQPVENRFYPSPEGIKPGEIVIINAATPAGLICTGVRVLYADDGAFTFMTPQGHPESGWVSFTAYEEQGLTVAQVQGFARASDPLFELGFVLMGSREQERIWKHVLISLGRHFGVYGSVNLEKTCVGTDYQWSRAGNVWYNAQIRTMLYTIRKALGY